MLVIAVIWAGAITTSFSHCNIFCGKWRCLMMAGAERGHSSRPIQTNNKIEIKCTKVVKLFKNKLRAYLYNGLTDKLANHYLSTVDIVLNLDIKRLVEVRHVKCGAKSLCLRC